MMPLKPRQQKIYVTCLVEHNGQILLLRGSQYADEACYDSIGYFGVPRFTLRFGVDPLELITQELQEQFGQAVAKPTIVSVYERLVDDYTQAIELVYRTQVQEPAAGQIGRYLFASIDTLEQYVLPDELQQLREWLGR